MKKDKKEFMKFLVWMRNGFAFCTTWLLILWLTFSYLFHQEFIYVNALTKLLILILISVLIFNLCFTEFMIRKWSFTQRLTCFMLSISLVEYFGFYWIGLFIGTGSILQWLIFISIVLILYFICISIYQRYSKKQGELYTQALYKYQLERKNSDRE